jgi:RNA-directed DNA polymerase
MRAKLKAVKEELRRRMHEPIPKQGAWLQQVVRGFFACHAVPTNWEALQAFRYHIERIWLCTLLRRSQKHRMTWDRMRKPADDWLPAPRFLHPWPDQRFAVNNSRWEPHAGIPLARICAGGGQK